MDTRVHSLIEVGALAIALLVGSFLAPNTLLLSGIQLFCLLYASHRLAPRFAPKHAPIPSLFITLASLLGIQSILQALAYYANIPLNLTTDIASQVIALTISYLAVYQKTPPPLSEEKGLSSPDKKNDAQSLFNIASVTIPALVGISFIIYHANRVATTNAIRTPWELLPTGTIVAFLLIVGSAWLAAWRRQSSPLIWSIVTLFFLALALVTPLVYPLGFGFDGFLHRASEHLLLTTGTLTPKPLYYMGQYVFTTWLTRVVSLPLRTVDLFLLVGSLAILPATLALKKNTSGTHRLTLLAALPFLLPLKPWISATPQSFAYLLGVSGLFLAQDEEHAALFPALILGLWSAVVHPLAGLPLLGGILLCAWQQYIHPHPWIKKMGTVTIALGSALAVPLAFFFIRGGANTQATWHLDRVFSVDQFATLANLLRTPAIRLSLWADWAAFVEFLFPLCLLVLAALGAWKNNRGSSARTLTGTGLLLLIATYAMQQITTFTFLIEYERQDYIQRLFLVGQLLLLPAALKGLAFVWENVKQQPAISLYGFLIFMAAWQGARIYRAFPYHDATHIEHGWNVSQNDKEAVRWIERDSQGKPYTVLANQSVSAAAVEEFGFKRYANDVFFYPIPTGGRLYQVFLRAASTQVTKKDIEAAAELGKSTLVYLVLNDYWWQATEVAETLTPLAHTNYELNRGAVRIYKFDLNKDKKR